MCLMEKIHVLRKFHSGVSHRAVGQEFNVNEPTVEYIQKNKEETCRFLQEAAPVSAKFKPIVQEEAMEKWLNVWTPFGIDAWEGMTNLKSTV